MKHSENYNLVKKFINDNHLTLDELLRIILQMNYSKALSDSIKGGKQKAKIKNA